MAETVEEQHSVQTFPDASKAAIGPAGSGLSPIHNALLRVLARSDCVPSWWSKHRDAWLRKFVLVEGNDILAGTISTVIAKIVATGWFLEGPERTANLYRRILLERSEFGAGWDTFVSKIVRDYLTQDAGAYMERIRLSENDTKGAAIGFAQFDAAQCLPLCDPEFPVEYTPMDSSDPPVNLHFSRVGRLVDMPSSRQDMCGVGLCALSRALMTAQILVGIAKYERERLSDLPPAGLLLLNNINSEAWEDFKGGYDTKQEQRGNEVWRNVMVAFGMDPNSPATAELFSFSDIPESFDKRVATEIAVFSFALAFRIDPREIWPTSAGALGGTATEANIQHIKARGKGTGILYSGIERIFNDGLSLPPSISFRFDYQDTEEDLQAAQIANEKARFIEGLWKPSPVTGMGIISQEQAQSWLVKEGLFDEEELLTFDEEGRATDIEEAKSGAVDMGPKVRAYGDGRTVSKRCKVWPTVKLGKSDPLGMAAENYVRGAIDAGQLAEYAIGLAVEGRTG